MTTITETLSNKHAHCDALFAEVEAQVANAHWDLVITNFTGFIHAIEQHFATEEQILFPTFEEQTGHTAGPTQVMRFEHEQMRQLFKEMQDSVAQQDSDQYLGLSETLLMLMRQHNAKEEQILYPMTDQVLGTAAPLILEQMRNLEKTV